MAELSEDIGTDTDGTAVDIVSLGKFSDSLRSILTMAAVTPEGPGPATKMSTANTTPATEWSLLSFLYQAALTRNDAPGAAQIFNGNADFLNTMTADMVAEHTVYVALTTQALAQALRDAIRIREMTGGKDAYIGLRHALFAVLLPPFPEQFQDTYAMLAAAGTSPVALAEAIADFCWDHMEDGEDPEVWGDLATERISRLEALPLQVMRPAQVATPGADDPWAPGKVDRSGAQLEADAFASMICWRDFTPPLAVGVFGDWGKGKSFFMRLIHDAIQERTRAETGFLNHVVQIRFNAWHYAETNLWASLVDHILSELDAWSDSQTSTNSAEQVFSRLDTARDWTLAAAADLIAQRSAKKEAEAALQVATEALAQKQQDLAHDPGAWRAGIWDEVFTEDIRPKYAQAAKDLGLTDEVLKQPDELGNAIALYRPESGGAVAQDWWRFIGNHTGWAAVMVTALFVLPTGLAALMASQGYAAVGGAVAGAVAPVAAAMAMVSRGLRTAHGRLASAHAKVQKRIDEKTAEETKKRAAAEAELAAAERAIAAAVDSLRDTEAALRAAEHDYDAETGKGRILKFVRDRITSGDYRKQLSFIAHIRRDFDELSALMDDRAVPKESEDRRKQHEKRVAEIIAKAEDTERAEGLASETLLTAEEKEKLQATCKPPERDDTAPVFERIVLYIDDLDRCPADQVVVVLQAIHLLLAYPLFVVFVAVDVRWLQQALTMEYDQFKDSGDPSVAHASASDYLEKIFQVPYWVRGMTPDNTSAFLGDLMAVSDKPDDTVAPVAPQPEASASPEPTATAQDGPSDAPVAEPQQAAPEIEPPSPQQLEFSSAEAAFVRTLSAGLDGSPRRTLRFVNSYRLIKASLSAKKRRALRNGGYRGVLALLAIQICSDEISHDATTSVDCFTALGQQLRSDPDKVLDWAKAMKTCSAQGRLVTVLEIYQSAGGTWGGLAEHLDVVARYSFAEHG